MSLTGRIRDILAIFLNGDDKTTNKFGYNKNIASTVTPTAPALIIPGGVWHRPVSAVALELLSTSAADASAGTGSQIIIAIGRDDNNAEITEEVIPTGLTPKALSTNMRRVVRAYSKTSGSGQTNDGDITIRTVSGSNTMAVIPANKGQTQQSVYTIKGDKNKSVIKNIDLEFVKAAAAGRAEGDLMTQCPGGSIRSRHSFQLDSGDNPEHNKKFFGGIKVEAGCDIWVQFSSVTQNASEIYASFDILEE